MLLFTFSVDNSDLNLTINRNDFCSAKAMSDGGFGYLWAGIRATHGVMAGRVRRILTVRSFFIGSDTTACLPKQKVCYQVRIDADCPVGHLGEEMFPNVLRCGWSVDDASLQLGEDPLSFGYGGTGKKSTDGKFLDYGIPFGAGDVIACFLVPVYRSFRLWRPCSLHMRFSLWCSQDMTSDPIIMQFSVNGTDMGIAFSVPKKALSGQALFPHIFTKNQDFSVNFGQMSYPMQSTFPDYSHIGQLGPDDGLVRGSRAPSSRGDCEVTL